MNNKNKKPLHCFRFYHGVDGNVVRNGLSEIIDWLIACSKCTVTSQLPTTFLVSIMFIQRHSVAITGQVCEVQTFTLLTKYNGSMSKPRVCVCVCVFSHVTATHNK